MFSMFRLHPVGMITLLVIFFGCQDHPQSAMNNEDLHPAMDNLFEIVPQDQAQLSPQQIEMLQSLRTHREVTRVNLVRVRYQLAERTNPKDQVTINLFPDVVAQLSFRNIERRSNTDYTWNGGDPLGGPHATIMVNQGILFGSIHVGRKLYQIRPIDGVLYVIKEIDQSRLPPELPPEPPPGLAPEPPPGLAPEPPPEFGVQGL